LLCRACFRAAKIPNEEKLIADFKEYKKKIFPYIENQCDAFGKSDFEGMTVSFDVVDADIREVLKFASPFGCNFVIDETVEKINMTVRVKDFPWNLTLQSVLEVNDLAIKIEESNLRIVKAPYESPAFFIKKLEKKPSEEPLYTEFVQFKYLLVTPQATCFPRSPSEPEPEEIRNAKKFINLIKKALSRYGAIEIDSRSNTLVITDEKEKVKLIVDFVKLLDESGLTLEEIVNNPNFEIK
jgi:type II secretory pathway component GspD/PulD (secretin)